MVFEIKNKIVLVTGAASGIGLALVREFLEKGAKGVTVADINADEGGKVADNLQFEFGENRVIFVQTDVSDMASFENAFKKTIETFKYIDVLVNSAELFDDTNWQRAVDVNLKGTINGIVLGLDTYLKNNKQTPEAVILNIASLFGVAPCPMVPVYAASKNSIVSLTQCWGNPYHFERTKVRIITVCPGLISESGILEDVKIEKTLNKDYDFKLVIDDFKAQSPRFTAQESIKLLENASNGSIWVIEEGEPAYQFFTSDKNTFKKSTHPCNIL